MTHTQAQPSKSTGCVPSIVLQAVTVAFAILGLAANLFAAIMLLLYLVPGVYTIIRRAEAQRLEEEKQAWEGCFS